MDLPIEVINAVKPKLKARKPYLKKLTKRILQAVDSGLRTSASIAKALNVPKAKIQSNMFHLKSRGLVYSKKQVGSLEHKYYLLSEKGFDAEKPEQKPRKPYAKRKSSYNKDGVNTSNSFNTPPKVEPTAKPSYVRHLENRVEELVATNNAIQAELIHAQAENFDLKAVIKYLERKGN